MKLYKMTSHYLVTALWSTVDYGNDDDCGVPLDSFCDLSDISEAFKIKAAADCEKLYELISHLIEESEDDLETIGHDFWLTRNGHGAGFWDGDYVNGDEITAIVKAHFPENDDDLRENVEKAA